MVQPNLGCEVFLIEEKMITNEILNSFINRLSDLRLTNCFQNIFIQ
nr:MAG TPA: hypothetical protein [Caudoviricetes sp.]